MGRKRGAVYSLVAGVSLVLALAVSPFYGIFMNIVAALTRRQIKEHVEARTKAQEKDYLLDAIHSDSHETAVQAVKELGEWGWLQDGTLIKRRLTKANLHDADLSNADVRGVNFKDADLRRTNWTGAKMQGVNLGFADLRGANLTNANLHLAFARNAKLGGADLRDANLLFANVDEVTFDEQTTLPDGSKWTPDSDVARFTDVVHPDFWRSQNVDSPAYLGDADATSQL